VRPGVGTQAIVARRHGEKDSAAAGAVLANSLVLVVVISAILTIAGWFLLPAIFRLMHDDPGVQESGPPTRASASSGCCR